MGNTLDSPRTEKEGEYYASQATGLTAGATGMQGWRLEMEDSHVVIDVEGAPGHMFLAVFDGHAGAGAAKYASIEIINRIKATPSWTEYAESNFTSIKSLGDALTAAFIGIDVDLRKHQDGTNGRDTSGCTSVTAMITPTHIVCANAGDSRCVMGTAGTTKALSEDHKPTNMIERERIENAGGFVQWSRVDGDLAVSRALGDFGYKSPSLEAKDQKISCVPDICEHVRTPDDDVLILACDGLWDVMTSKEAVDTVREIYQSGEKNALLIAEEMIDLALNKGSKDNISSVIVILPGAKFGPESQGGVAARRQQRQEADNAAARPDSYPGSPDGKTVGPGDSPASKDDA